MTPLPLGGKAPRGSVHEGLVADWKKKKLKTGKLRHQSAHSVSQGPTCGRCQDAYAFGVHTLSLSLSLSLSLTGAGAAVIRAPQRGGGGSRDGTRKG